jgi:Tfp pilus assembly protein PilX
LPTSAMTYAGPAMASAPATEPPPKIVIENLPSVAVAGDDISVSSLNPASPPVTVYRVTAQGVGADGTSTTTLQTIVR